MASSAYYNDKTNEFIYIGDYSDMNEDKKKKYIIIV